MMRIRLACVLVMGAMLMACQDDGGAVNTPQPKIGVVDVARLMRDSAPGKEAVKFIENQQSAMQGQLDAAQEKLEKNPQDEAAMRDFQSIYAAAQQRIQAEGQNVANTLFDVIQKVLNEYREKNGYDALIGADALASFSQKIDVTNGVMAEIDKQKIEFKPLPQPAKPDLAAPEVKAEDRAVEKPADEAAKSDAEPEKAKQQ